MRILLYIAGAAAGVFVLAAFLLVLMVDPNKYKSEVSALVKAKTGRELVFEGDVSLAFFPRLGVRTGPVRLSCPPGFGDGPFLRAASARVGVKLLPLLAGKARVSRVDIAGLELHLQRDAAGRANWADLVGGPEERANASTSWGLAGLSLDGVRLSDATVTWEDKQTGSRYAIANADAELQAIRPGRPFHFETNFVLQSAAPQYDAQVRLSGSATLNLGGGQHVLTNLGLTAVAQGRAVPGGRGDFSMALRELKVDAPHRTAEGDGLTLSAYGAKATGRFIATNIDDAPEFKGRLDIPDFDGRRLSAALTGVSMDSPRAEAYRHIAAGIEFRRGRGLLEVPEFTASLDDARVEGSFHAEGLDKRSYRLDARITGLDVDRFLPARKAETPAAEAAEESAPLINAEKLRALTLDGRIVAQRVKFRGLRLSSLDLPLSARGGVLDAGPAVARLYDGEVSGSLRVDARGAEPRVTLSGDVAGVRLQPFLTDRSGRPSAYAGALSTRTLAPLSGQGVSLRAIKRSLSGKVRFAVRDGVFPGVNLLSVAREAGRERGLVRTSATDATRFGSVDGTAVVSGGVARVADLGFKAPFLRASGRVDVDLATKQTAGELRLRVVPNAAGQGGGSGFVGLPVPLRVSGPYDNPTFTTDYLRSIGQSALDAVGGVVHGIKQVFSGGSGKRRQSGVQHKNSGGFLDRMKNLF